jgi:hypothetical protein
MVAWIPAVKAILPFLAQIVTAAIPAFTTKADKTGTDELTRNQIAELQEAVTHNAESLKTLAAQLQQFINGIDAGSAKIEKEIKTVKHLAITAISFSAIAIVLWLYSWLS